jgi:hypothetical protein
MGDSVRLFEESFMYFMNNPDGETLRDMEIKRENMFLTCRISMQITFPEIDDTDIKDAIRISKQIKAFKASSEESTNK